MSPFCSTSSNGSILPWVRIALLHNLGTSMLSFPHLFLSLSSPHRSSSIPQPPLTCQPQFSAHSPHPLPPMWDILPPDNCMACPLTSFRSLFRSHFSVSLPLTILRKTAPQSSSPTLFWGIVLGNIL